MKKKRREIEKNQIEHMGFFERLFTYKKIMDEKKKQYLEEDEKDRINDVENAKKRREKEEDQQRTLKYRLRSMGFFTRLFSHHILNKEKTKYQLKEEKIQKEIEDRELKKKARRRLGMGFIEWAFSDEEQIKRKQLGLKAWLISCKEFLEEKKTQRKKEKEEERIKEEKIRKKIEIRKKLEKFYKEDD